MILVRQRAGVTGEILQGKRSKRGVCLGLITPGRRSCLFGRVQQCARVRAACAQLCAQVCARSHGASGPGLRGAPQPGLPADRGGRVEPAGLRAGRAVRKRVPRGSLCVGCGSAPPAGTIFCFARDRHIKGKAAAARRRPLSLRCPLLQVYYYSTGRAASPRGLAACRAVQRSGRLHAWRAPKPPPPPPYLSEKQPHVEA